MNPNIFNAGSHWAGGRVRSRRSVLIIALTLCCAGLIMRAHSGLRTESRHAETLAETRLTSQPVTQANSREPVQILKFDLYDVAVLPREAHAEEGLIWFVLEDYSGGTTGLVVERETTNTVQQVGSVQRDGPHWRGKSEIRLGPGRYRVHMADRPGNQAVLIVGARGN